MNFQKWNDRRVPQRRSLRLNANNMNIGRDAYEELGSPERIDVLFDPEAKVIKLVAAEDGRKVNIKPTPHLSIKLARVMPTGKYNLTDGVFVLEELQNGQ